MIKNSDNKICRIDYGKNQIQYFIKPATSRTGPYQGAYRVYAGNKLVFPSVEEIYPRYCLKIARIRECHYDVNLCYTEHHNVIIRTSLPLYVKELTFGDAPEGEDWRNTDILTQPRKVHVEMWKRIDTILAFGLPFIERGSIEGDIRLAPSTREEFINKYPPPLERDSTFIYCTESRTGSQTTLQKVARGYTPSVYYRRRNFDGYSGGGSHYNVSSRASVAADERYENGQYQWTSMMQETTYEFNTPCTYGMKNMPSFCNGEVCCPIDMYRFMPQGESEVFVEQAKRIYRPFYKYFNGSVSYVGAYNHYANYDICNYHVLENNNPGYSSYEEWLQDINQEGYNPKPPLYEIPFNAGTI